MSSFCPLCGNALLVHDEPHFRFCCRTCPYQHAITTKFKFPLALKKKEVDDVLGGAEAWENVDQTDAICPKCETTRAFFMQIQTRSADEPMTTFYKCTNFDCGHQWKE